MATIKNTKAIPVLFDSGPIMVLLHMNGCGHCEMLKPAWKEATREINKEKGLLPIAEIESEFSNQLPNAIRESILGYPTILIIQNGKKKKEYKGDRTKNDLVNFARNNSPKPKAPNKPKTKSKTKKGGDCGCNKS
jgi:thiol-disulfide isomerase/thioredoxin